MNANTIIAVAQSGDSIGTIVAIVALVIFVLGTIAVLFSRYKMCPSDKILIVYGNVGAGKSAKCIHGGATFVLPIVQNYAFMDLNPINIDVPLKGALSSQNIRVDVPSSFIVGISTQPEIMQNAASRLLGRTRQDIRDLASEIIMGQMRVVIASLTIEEINADREKLIKGITNGVDVELHKVGLYLINANITDIRDASGYIAALGQEAAARAINDAMIKVAEETRRGEIGKAEALRDQTVQVAMANAAAVEGETVEQIVVIFNATKSPVQVTLPTADWKVVVNDTKAGTETLATATSFVNVPAISAMVLTQGEIEVEPTTYTLTIDANGGAVYNGQPSYPVGAYEGHVIDENFYNTLFVATREGYTLTGWNTKADGSGEPLAIPYTRPAHDVTFYAIWEENKPVIEKFDIAFAQIDMGNALGMNFAFPAVEDIDFTGAYAEATMAGSTQTIPADKWTTASIGGAAHYVFGYSNIAAKQMADEITIVIYNADGEAISNEYVDSIQSYVMRNVDKKDAESKALMVDMLNYGAAAQTYYGYNAEDLANAQLSDAQKAYGTAELTEITDIRVKGANYLGTRLELGSSIGMQMNFAGTTADMYAIVEFTNHGDTEISERVAPTEIDGVYLINITQIAVADGRMPVTVTVYNADGSVYGTATDSMASYIARMSNADALYKCIMKFSDSAYAYLH